MSLPHALLGLLAVKPRSGYELTKTFEGDLGRYAWQAGHTSIYPELAKLAGRGLVEVAEEGPRGSRTYAVTDAGRAELRGWLFAPPRQAKVRNELVLRMFLISALEPAEAAQLLAGIAESTERDAAELRAIRHAYADAPMTGPEGFGQLAAEYGLRQYEAVRDWARWAVERVAKEA